MNTLDYQRIFHEIKNTITLVNSSMQLLDRKCPQLESEPYWINVKREITYLKNMILEISQAGNAEQLHKEPLDLNNLLKTTCQSMLNTYADLQWDFHLDKKLPVVYGDSIKLRQAVLNLLKNSAEAMNGSGYITITTKTADSAVLISVADSGSGIPAELESTVFDLFTTSKKQGSGLGLAITKQIIEHHNGTLTLDNHPNEGCNFTISLPISTECS